jgi:uncharacterized membrane protein YfbV (UPF0208 family)
LGWHALRGLLCWYGVQASAFLPVLGGVGMDSFLIPLFCILAVILFYPALTIYVAMALNLGAFAWLTVATMLSPYVALWYYVVRKRVLSYIKLLMDNKPRVWDIEKTLAEYKDLLKKDKK